MIGQHLKKEAGTQDPGIKMTPVLQNPCLQGCHYLFILFGWNSHFQGQDVTTGIAV